MRQARRLRQSRASAHERGDIATAVGLWQQRAEDSNARAAASPGDLYRNGDGVARDV